MEKSGSQNPTSLIKGVCPLDVALTKMVFDLMYKVFPEYPLTWLGDEMQNSIYIELISQRKQKMLNKQQNISKLST